MNDKTNCSTDNTAKYKLYNIYDNKWFDDKNGFELMI